ncbi:MAG: alpha/beta fold hydrolase [Desulfobulbaceae bacterium]|jgi:hypothetical protein|nr:alpha/beta fold hydrolase [Desulfobulbaceae bacterium]
MRATWLRQQREAKALILFCNGFGMDQQPFQALDSRDYDVLCLFDYHDLQAPGALPQLLTEYERCFLVAWSMGVWVGQHLCGDYADLLAGAIAINGTLTPIDAATGIAPTVFSATADDWNEQARDKFYRRMFMEDADFRRFVAQPPKRSCAEQKEELLALIRQTRQSETVSPDRSIYTLAVIATNDRIFASRNQRRAWQGRATVQARGGHFPFYDFAAWDDIVALTATSSAEKEKVSGPRIKPS